jgi:hypothetical protein
VIKAISSPEKIAERRIVAIKINQIIFYLPFFLPFVSLNNKKERIEELQLKEV